MKCSEYDSRSLPTPTTPWTPGLEHSTPRSTGPTRSSSSLSSTATERATFFTPIATMNRYLSLTKRPLVRFRSSLLVPIIYECAHYNYYTLCFHASKLLQAHLQIYSQTQKLLKMSCSLKLWFNRTACIRHQCSKTTVLSCHRCLTNTGIEK